MADSLTCLAAWFRVRNETVLDGVGVGADNFYGFIIFSLLRDAEYWRRTWRASTGVWRSVEGFVERRPGIQMRLVRVVGSVNERSCHGGERVEGSVCESPTDRDDEL